MNNSACSLTCIKAPQLFDSDCFKNGQLAAHKSALVEQAKPGGSGR